MVSIFLLLSLFRCRLHNGAGSIDGSLGGIDGAHDIGSGGGVQTEGPGDPGHLTRGEHEAQSQQSVVLKHHQARYQNGGLQEGRQAQANHLFAPLDKAVCVASGDAEHIEASHGDLDEQDAASFEVGEKDLNHSIGHHDDAEQKHDRAGEDAQAEAGRARHIREALHAHQFLDDPFSHGPDAGSRPGQADGEGPLQGYRQGVEPYRYYGEQAHRHEALDGVEGRLLYYFREKS